MKKLISKYHLGLILLIVSTPLWSQSYNIENKNEIFFAVSKDNLIGIVDTNQEVVIPIEYNSIQSNFKGKNLLIVSKQELNSKTVKWGAVDRNNRIVIPFKFERLNNWQSENYIVGIIKSNDGKETQKVFDYSGSEVFPSNIENAWYYNDTIAKVKNTKCEYLINKNGDILTKKYNRIFGMASGMIQFQEGELAGFLDSNYIEVIPAIYDWFPTGFFKENGLANVRYDDEWTEAEIRKDGSEAFNIGMNYRYADGYRKENFILAYEVDPSEGNSSYDHCLFDFIDGRMIYNFGPSMAGAGYQVFKEEIAFWGRPMYQEHYELTIIKYNGELIHKTKIPIVENYTNDALIVLERNKNRNKYGIMPMNNSSQIEMKFDSIHTLRNFEDNSIAIIAKQTGKFGVIDKNASIILDLKFDNIIRIESGDIVASKNGKSSLYSINGELKIKDSQYPIVNSIKGHQLWFIVRSNSKYGVYDFKSESWIINPVYSNIETIE